MIRGKRTGVTCIRRSLCAVNAFAWLVGCAVLGVGIWLKVSYSGYGDLLPSALPLNAVCLAVGSIVFVVSLCGCCGSWITSRCMLVTYFSLVVVVLVLEVAAVALLFTFREGLSDTVQAQLREGLSSLNGTLEGDPGMHSWHAIQTTFRCCGVAGAGDWSSPDRSKGWLPASCCPQENNNKKCRLLRRGLWFRRGCYDVVSKWLMKKLHIIGAVALSFVFVQLLVLIAALLLICTMSEKRKSQTYKSYATDSIN